jgi:hypothetical protein
MAAQRGFAYSTNMRVRSDRFELLQSHTAKGPLAFFTEKLLALADECLLVALCHEYRRSTRRCVTVREMKEDLSHHDHNGGDRLVLYRSQQSAHNDTESAVQRRKS